MTLSLVKDSAALAPMVQVPCVLDIVVGIESVTLDTAIDTLSGLCRMKKQIEAEEKALRGSVSAAMAEGGLKTHITASGVRATSYDSSNTSPDWKYLESILTPEQMVRAKKSTAYTALKIT